MPPDTHPFAIPFMLSAVISLMVALVVFRRQHVKSGVALGLLMLEFAAWAGANAVRLSLNEPYAQLPWLRLEHAVLAPAPLTFFIFVTQLTDTDRWLNNFNMLLLAIEPFVTIFVIATNEAHGLYYTSFLPVSVGGFREMTWNLGPWFWFNTACSYLFIMAATITLVRTLLRAGPYLRNQLLTVLIGSLLPWGANVYTFLSPAGERLLAPAPLATAGSGLIFAYALFRQRLLDIAPVARTLLFEKLVDAVLVLDRAGRIVDLNAAARQLMEVGREAHGRPLAEVAPNWRDLAEQLDRYPIDMHLELHGRVDPQRYFDVSVIPLLDSRNDRTGYLVSVRDISQRKNVEMEVQRMNARLRRQVNKISSLHEELREQSIRDGLTGLFNRRYLNETLERELSRARRAGYSIGIILMDVDEFKRVNDTYGHKAGDRVLRGLGKVIRGQIRASDVPCRYGGEEFVIVMPETSLDIAFERAEQIRQQFGASRFFKVQGGVVPRLSVGVAVYPTHGRTAEKLLHAADQAMYLAKSQGGDRALRYDSRQKTMPVPVGKVHPR